MKQRKTITDPSGFDYIVRDILCDKCKAPADERLSLGLYAGDYCEPCWDKTPYRKEGPEGFNAQDWGESYDDDY